MADILLEYKKTDLCRLCLTVPDGHMYKMAQDGPVLRNIHSCLNVQINLDKSLPDTVCTDCINKIEDIYEFRRTVLDNQHKLQQQRTVGLKQLANFYDNLKVNNKEKSIHEKQNIIHIDIPSGKDDALEVSNISNEDPLKTVTLPDRRVLSSNTPNLIPLNIKTETEECKEDPMKCEEDSLDWNDDNKALPTENDQEDIDMKITSSADRRVLSSNTPSPIPLNIKTETEECKKDQIKCDEASLDWNDDNKALPTENDQEDIDMKITSCTERKNVDNVKPFSCLTCFQLLPSQIDLVRHYTAAHKDTVKSLRFKYIENSSSEKTLYNCRLCDSVYDNKEDISKHVVTHRRLFVCMICGRTYNTISEIVRHGRAHYGAKLVCSYRCGFSTAYKGALTAHEKRHSDQIEYKYQCSECGKGFFVKTWYEQHQNIHKGLKPFVCDICGMAFHMSRYLTTHKSATHKQTLAVKRYICVHCQHPCDTAKSLSDHLKEHLIKSEYLCDECGKNFSDWEKLRKHKYIHLRFKFPCSKCDLSFAKKFTLKLHEHSHTGERRYTCAHCNKRYVQKASLGRHCRKYHSELSTEEPNEINIKK